MKKSIATVANVVTCIRIICGVILLFCRPFSQRFYLVYMIGGLSDILDGFIARRLKTESELGARLDTIADIVFAIAVLVKVLNGVYVPLWLIIWIICIAVIKCVNIISGIVISGHFVTEHTLLNKACGVLLFAVPLCIGRFPWQPVAVLVILSCAVATAAAVQEGHYIRTGKEIN